MHRQVDVLEIDDGDVERAALDFQLDQLQPDCAVAQ
jgi:hypothetical protein